MSPGARRPTRAAHCLWVLAILLGSGSPHQLIAHFAPAATQLVTAAWVGLYLLALATLVLEERLAWLIWTVRYRLLLLLLMLGAALSISWAIDPQLAALRVIHLFGASLVALAAGLCVPLPALLRSLGAVLALLMLGGLVAVFAEPVLGSHEYDGGVVWRGLFGDKNALGFNAAVGAGLFCCLALAAERAARRALCWGACGLCLAMLFQARSATSVAALAAGASFVGLLWLARQIGLSLAQQALLALLGSAFAVSALQALSSAWVNQLLGRSGTLTGRAEVWAQTWALIKERPFSGYGFGNLWRPTPNSGWIQEQLTDFSWTVYHAHNGLLQVGSEVGLVMALLAVLFAVQQLIESLLNHHRERAPLSAFVLFYSVAFLLSNYAEARLLVDRDLHWLLWLALPISALQTQLRTACEAPPAAGHSVPGYRPPPLRSVAQEGVATRP